MPNTTNRMRQGVPPWALVTVAVLGILTLGYFGWRALTGQEADAGPAKKVTPGMYDLRAEAAKMRQQKETGAGGNGP